jgi:hypothetical protein
MSCASRYARKGSERWRPSRSRSAGRSETSARRRPRRSAFAPHMFALVAEEFGDIGYHGRIMLKDGTTIAAVMDTHRPYRNDGVWCFTLEYVSA